jgi:hypothetical protein
MKYRKLRIAFSAVCGGLCLLMILLWVRSYWAPQSFAGLGYNGVSKRGVIAAFRAKPIRKFDVDLGYSVIRFGVPVADFAPLHGRLGFYKLWDKKLWILQIPYWSLVAMTIMFSAVPWANWSRRFSLRTLLIATTLVAILMGLIVCAAS